MSNFFGNVAIGRTKGLDRNDARDKEAREETLRQALMVSRISEKRQATTKTAEAFKLRIALLKTHPDLVGRSDEELRPLAEDNEVFRSYTQRREPKAPPRDPVAEHKAMRDYDITHPLPRAAVTDNPGVRARAGLSAVEKQLAETRSQIKNTAPKPLGTLSSAQDSSDFRKRRAAIPPLENRADSLSAVRDRLAAEVQGRRTASSSRQQQDWDEAASVIRSRGGKPDSVLGARPVR